MLLLDKTVKDYVSYTEKPFCTKKCFSAVIRKLETTQNVVVNGLPFARNNFTVRRAAPLRAFYSVLPTIRFARPHAVRNRISVLIALNPTGIII